jgi:homoserine kinase
VVVPDFLLPTKQARQALPAEYRRADVVFNIQHAATLVAALAAGELEALGYALADRIHQPYRAGLVPGLEEILKLQAPGLFGCCLSGAGPSVLVFHDAKRPEAAELVRDVFAKSGRASEVLATAIDREGYTLVEIA